MLRPNSSPSKRPPPLSNVEMLSQTWLDLSLLLGSLVSNLEVEAEIKRRIDGITSMEH